jgi:hypothetical protein
MTARNLSGQCVIGRGTGNNTDPHFKLAPDDGTAAVWTMASTALSTSLGPPAGCAVEGSYVYVALDGEDGTYDANGRLLVQRLNLSDGTVDWGTNTNHGGASSLSNCRNGVSLSSADLYLEGQIGGDEIKRHTSATGAIVATSGNDSDLGTGTPILCVSPDGDYLVAVGNSERVGRWSLPLTGTATQIDSTATGYLDIKAGVDTTLTVAAVNVGDYSGRCVPSRVAGSNTVWFVTGIGTAGDAYAFEYDPATGTPGTIDTELDAMSDSTLTGSGHALDMAVDRFGYLYVLVIDSQTAATFKSDVVRYTPAGVLDLDFTTTVSANMPRGTSHGGTGVLPTRIAVCEEDTVYIGDRDGYLHVFTQT